VAATEKAAVTKPGSKPGNCWQGATSGSLSHADARRRPRLSCAGVDGSWRNTLGSQDHQRGYSTPMERRTPSKAQSNRCLELTGHRKGHERSGQSRPLETVKSRGQSSIRIESIRNTSPNQMGNYDWSWIIQSSPHT
jgi:hypothetical protein